VRLVMRFCLHHIADLGGKSLKVIKSYKGDIQKNSLLIISSAYIDKCLGNNKITP